MTVIMNICGEMKHYRKLNKNIIINRYTDNIVIWVTIENDHIHGFHNARSRHGIRRGSRYNHALNKHGGC